MDLLLNRDGAVPLRDQLVAQIELRILSGAYPPGARLPSVRALARRLELHANTVSAAYQDLESAGHVELRRGAGVFVRARGPASLADAGNLDEMIRFALHTAFGKGYSGAEVRAAVERWLAAAPPDRLVAVDPSLEMAELMAHEARSIVRAPVESRALADVLDDPQVLSGAVAACLVFHEAMLREVAPAVEIEALTLQVGDAERKAIAELPAGAIVLIVSHAPTVLPIARAFVESRLDGQLVVESRLLSDARGWRRLTGAADLVIADALSYDRVRAVGARNVRQARLVSRPALQRLARRLATATDRKLESSTND